MRSNMAYVLGVIVGILCVVVVSVLWGRAMKKRGKECKYDERQMLARGEAFKAGFFTLMGYEIVVGLGTLIFEMEWFADSFANSILGIGIATTVFVSKCILEDAYFSINADRTVMLGTFAVLGIANGVIAICQFLDREIIVNGQLTYRIGNLVVSLMTFALLIASFVKRARDRREPEE